jgi:hypothetical protein
VRRLINGGAGIIFKGSGFYVTDKSKESTKTVSSEGKNKAEGKKAGPETASGGGEPGAANAAASDGKAGSSACASCPASAASGGSCPGGAEKSGKKG